MEAHERRTLPEGWEWKKVEDVIEKVPLTGKKLKQSEYQKVGKFPVIDQGQSFMGGYTDKEDLKIFCESPVIIFGDHTRAIKYVDFDFVAGADGIQVMKPEKVFHPKLFYYFVRAIQLPDKGYARHFQLLEKSQIPLPPLPTQRRIVSILEKAEETKKLRAQADELMDRLLQSVFLEMFGDPVRNPKGWEKSIIDAITVHHKQGFYTNSEYTETGIKLIRITDITEYGSITYDDMPCLNLDSKTIEQFKVQKGDFLFARSGVSIGRCAIVEKDIPCVFGSYIIRFRFDQNKINNKFFLFLMKLPRLQSILKNYAHGSTNPNINAENINNIAIFIPPLPLQQKFARIVEKIEAMRQSQAQSKQQIKDLFSTLMQKAFRGELER